MISWSKKRILVYKMLTILFGIEIRQLINWWAAWVNYDFYLSFKLLFYYQNIQDFMYNQSSDW